LHRFGRRAQQAGDRTAKRGRACCSRRVGGNRVIPDKVALAHQPIDRRQDVRPEHRHHLVEAALAVGEDQDAAIQCSEPAQLVDTLFQALRVLVGTSTQSYGERIVNRLAEMLPEETLPRLEAVRAERAGVATLSIVAA
jgi:hypothetical protein